MLEFSTDNIFVNLGLVHVYFNRQSACVWVYYDLFLYSYESNTKRYEKRDYFNFPIVSYPFICSNISTAPAYSVLYISVDDTIFQRLWLLSRGSFIDEATEPKVPIT
jgi:hypothetical protein